MLCVSSTTTSLCVLVLLLVQLAQLGSCAPYGNSGGMGSVMSSA